MTDLTVTTDNDGIIATPNVAVPDYLEKWYWWAYARPWAIKFWERDWLINLILWFQYKRLRGEALAGFGDELSGQTLQLSCAYGALTPMLHKKITEANGKLDVVDAVIYQLRNLKRKIPGANNLRLMNMDATALSLPDQTYDRVLMFFLPHELPKEAKEKAFNEAFRVAKPGAKILVVEFSKPKWWNPLRYIYLPFLSVLEPFAPQIWKNDDIRAWIPEPFVNKLVNRKKIFGDYYQILTFKA